MTKLEKRKILVAMSGGVDSSVAALLLKKEGHDLVGAFMKVWSGADGNDPCWIEDRRDAMRVAAMLGIPLVTLDFEDEYRQDVVSNLFDEYAAGRTPNPDVRCNASVKFPLLWREARRLGCEAVATGHYARVEDRNGSRALLCGVDSEKDQSYFLHRLRQDDLAHTIFPLGELAKDRVREIAREAGFPNADKRSTRGICFIGAVDLPEFLRSAIPARPGDIVTTGGEIVGRPRGLAPYTVGQRQGGGVGGGAPYYVVTKDVQANTLVVASEENLSHDVYEMTLGDVYWILGVPSFPFRCSARIRYRQPLEPFVLNENDGGFLVRFARSLRGVAGGQSVVFYEGALCLGGGIIR